MGHRAQRLRIAHRIGLAEAQLRRQRQRGGAFQAGLDAELQCHAVDGRDAVGIEQRQRQRMPRRTQRGG